MRLGLLPWRDEVWILDFGQCVETLGDLSETLFLNAFRGLAENIHHEWWQGLARQDSLLGGVISIYLPLWQTLRPVDFVIPILRISLLQEGLPCFRAIEHCAEARILPAWSDVNKKRIRLTWHLHPCKKRGSRMRIPQRIHGILM